MDEIEIFLNGVYVFSFFETSLMMCGENVKNSALFDVAEKILPSAAIYYPAILASKSRHHRMVRAAASVRA